MKNIIVVFEKDKGIVPWIIRKLTKSEVNHVAISYESADWEGEWVAEAATKGVRTVPRKHRQWRKAFKIKYNAVDHVREAGEYIGNKYDFAGLFGFGWIILMWNLFKVRVRKPWRSASKQLCSEWVSRILIHHDEISFEDPEWVNPQQIVELCEQRPDLFEEIQVG